MTEVSKIVSLFEKATSPQEARQIDFAKEIPVILSAFPKEWISSNFIPFLTTWLPRNNKNILPIIIQHYYSIAQASENLLSTVTLAEAILSVGDSNHFDIMAKAVKAFRHDDTLPDFVQKIATSPFDSVRSFAPRLVHLVNTKKEIMNMLIFDSAFVVRQASALAMPNLPPELAAQIALSLLSDQSSRIRSIIPRIVHQRRFWLSLIAPKLVEDYDWCVRASVARTLAISRDPDEAFQFALKLASDNVWQVKLCAIRSLSKLFTLLKRPLDIKPQLIITLLTQTVRFPQLSLKIAAIDAFVALHKIADTIDPTIFIKEIIDNQGEGVHLHFFEVTTSGNRGDILKKIQDNLFVLIQGLVKSEKWRVRMGAVSLLNTIITLTDKEGLQDQFIQLCLEVLSDSARPVREAADHQLAMFILQQEGTPEPEYLEELSKSAAFRRRQGCIKILAAVYKGISDEDKKKSIKGQIEKFTTDSCPNVSLFAQEVVKSLV